MPSAPYYLFFYAEIQRAYRGLQRPTEAYRGPTEAYSKKLKLGPA